MQLFMLHRLTLSCLFSSRPLLKCIRCPTESKSKLWKARRAAATVASAMAWEREGEELGANGGVQEGRGATWSSSRPSGRREGEAGRRAAAWRAAVPPPSTLAACLASQAARWSGGRAGPARWGSWAGPDGPPGKRQVRCFALLFYFYFSYCFLFFSVFCFFNTSATLLNY